MATEYIVVDRITATNVSFQVDDGQIKIVDTASAASAEPIFEDITDTGIYWNLYSENNQIGWDNTLTIQNDNVTLEDVITATNYRLKIDAGQFLIDTDLTHPSDGGAVLLPRLMLLGVG